MLAIVARLRIERRSCIHSYCLSCQSDQRRERVLQVGVVYLYPNKPSNQITQETLYNISWRTPTPFPL